MLREPSIGQCTSPCCPNYTKNVIKSVQYEKNDAQRSALSPSRVTILSKVDPHTTPLGWTARPAWSSCLDNPGLGRKKHTRKDVERKSRRARMRYPSAGHLFLKPSAHLLYRTSASCLVCSIPGVSWPGRFICLSIHMSPLGITADCRRR